MRKQYPICNCNGSWIDITFIFQKAQYLYGIDQESPCDHCGLYPWGDAYNDNVMRDLQEMNQ